MQTGLLISFLNLLLLHPIHVSVSSIEYIPENKKIEVLFKIYKDDFKKVLNAKYELNINKEKEEDFINNENFILFYIKNNFKIFINQKQLKKITFNSLETDKLSIWINLTFEKVKDLSQVYIDNSLLLDLYNDQTNLLITNINGKQQGYSLDSEKQHVEISIK